MSWRLLSSLGSGGRRRGSLTVLFFHRVFAEPDPLMPGEPWAGRFDAMLGWLQSQFNVLPLAEAMRRLAEDALPPAAAAITFDDGYRDNAEVAAPLLLARGLPATFFVCSGFIDGGLMWNDGIAEAIRHTAHSSIDLAELGAGPLATDSWAARGVAVDTLQRRLKYLPPQQRDAAVQVVERHCGTVRPRNLMMSSGQLRGLVQQGFEIGAHTVSHPILERLDDAAAVQEIERSRQQLEARIDRRVPLFAYPNGRVGRDYTDRHRAMVRRAGFDAAFSTNPGVCRRGSDIWALPRFTPWGRTQSAFRLQLLRNQWSRPAPGKELAA